MTIFQAFILGLAQGLGEFLPISSSAHLILIPWLFHWPDPGLTFDVALHLGTLIAVIAYFWSDWFTLFRHGLSKGFQTQEGRMFWYLVIASIPGAIAGVLLEKKAETTFRSPVIIGIMLMIMGLILYAADRYGSKRQKSEAVSLGQSLTIGISQALAVIPGVSRSGITMTSGLFLGLTRESAARFSFLLSTPIIAGAGLLELRHLTVASINVPFIVGVATAAVAGFLVIGLLFKWLRRNSFLPFVVYRLLLGAAVIGIFLMKK
ncbi:MAG TPA: undecaprenyl-diphosphatase UppP [Bacillota bacterium]|nr:undecaprenyl-diphosphatase UppP [Bacillota bacterium]